jgi:replicative DNA helicase|tara:strand:- start:972 stop:2192 length:1221 start_codon:yes stop_codon:yes gene_type:complete
MENIELNVLATMLSKSVWDRVKNFITPSMFPKDWRTIAHTIRKAHLDYEDIDKLDKPSLVAVHKILYPATPDSKAEQVDVLIDNLLSIQTVNEELAYDWAKVFWQRDIARQIGEKAVEFWTGDNELAFSDIAKMMDRVSSNSLEPHDTFVIIRDDFQELVQATTETPDFTFGIPTLEENLRGMNRGDFGIIFARPEVGKTSFCAYLTAHYLACGFKVHYWANEELAKKVKLRIITSYFNVDKATLKSNKTKYLEEYKNIIDKNLVVVDSVGTKVEEIVNFTALNKPDVIFIDQMDKVKIDGLFSRGDEKLKELYVAGRELAKRNNCLVWAISQASYEAHQKEVIDYSMLDNSRTGKAGEADVIVGIGKNLGIEDNTRWLTVSKNKINGWHGTVHASLNIATGKYYT